MTLYNVTPAIEDMLYPNVTTAEGRYHFYRHSLSSGHCYNTKSSCWPSVLFTVTATVASGVYRNRVMANCNH